MKQKSYSNSFKIGFAKAYKSSGAKTVSKFIHTSTHVDYKDIVPHTAQKQIRAYDKGELKDLLNGNNCLRVRNRLFENVETRLVKYINFRRQRVVHDKCGLSWNLLIEKAKAFAEQEKTRDPENNNKAFNGSNGWLRGVLRRNNLGSLKLHGEGGEVSPEHAEEKMREFRVKLADELKKNDVSIDRIYNADQTGLFYSKLPNTIYCDKNAIKDRDNPIRGVKAMKDKDRLTIMVATCADGSKVVKSNLC